MAFIFVDYGYTLDTSEDIFFPEINVELAAQLAEFRKNGDTIILATDGNDHDAVKYEKNLKTVGFPSLFDHCITSDTFSLRKKREDYWPSVFSKFNITAEDIIFIDDNEEILNNAQRAKIRTVASKPKETVVPKLVAARAYLAA